MILFEVAHIKNYYGGLSDYHSEGRKVRVKYTEGKINDTILNILVVRSSCTYVVLLF